MLVSVLFDGPCVAGEPFEGSFQFGVPDAAGGFLDIVCRPGGQLRGGAGFVSGSLGRLYLEQDAAQAAELCHTL